MCYMLHVCSCTTHWACRWKSSWCRQQEDVLTTRTVKECWFTDEISLEHGPHPAGESHPVVPVTTFVLASL